MFSKPLQTLAASDIQKVIDDQIKESDTVEFKESLPGKDGPDGWHEGAQKVGDRARNEIVREVIAFANAHGGTLVLGIEESPDHPRRAMRPKPIPECADLASRIAMFCRDMVEPPLAPHPTIVSIPLDSKAGVVVIEVTRSRNAPHRHTADRECYVRKGERTERMTMREIQDLTVAVERGLSGIEKRFAERKEMFSQRPSIGLALRATAIPLSPLSIPVRSPTLHPSRRHFEGAVGARAISVTLPHEFGSFRPILRGVRAQSSDESGAVHVELREDGLVELTYTKRAAEQLMLYAGWFIGLVCNAIDIVDNARNEAGAPGTEYGLDLEIHSWSGLPVGAYGGREYGFDARLPAGQIVFPRYSVGGRDDFPNLVQLIDRDFWNACGRNPQDPAVVVKF